MQLHRDGDRPLDTRVAVPCSTATHAMHGPDARGAHPYCNVCVSVGLGARSVETQTSKFNFTNIWASNKVVNLFKSEFNSTSHLLAISIF